MGRPGPHLFGCSGQHISYCIAVPLERWQTSGASSLRTPHTHKHSAYSWRSRCAQIHPHGKKCSGHILRGVSSPAWHGDAMQPCTRQWHTVSTPTSLLLRKRPGAFGIGILSSGVCVADELGRCGMDKLRMWGKQSGPSIKKFSAISNVCSSP